MPDQILSVIGLARNVTYRVIWNGKGFERVSLGKQELMEVHRFVLDYNSAVVRECIQKAQKEFPDMEPGRRPRWMPRWRTSRTRPEEPALLH